MVSSCFVEAATTHEDQQAYLNLILGDKTGQLEGRVWEPGDRASRGILTRAT